ncbi:MAG: hypothetical protein RJA70_788 [Pseudomonadota bacterium]|jgi:colanic acid/amylovoran biosynthesis protein
MPRFVLTGTFSSNNKGDAAMELCATQQLLKAFPGADIVISTPFPDLDRDAYPGARIVASQRRRLIAGTAQVLSALVWRKVNERTGLNLAFLKSHAETEQMQGADLVIDLSGDMLTEDYGPHVAYSHFLPLLLAYALGKKVFVCAQSIGPFSLTKPLARFALNRAECVTARDEITVKHLRDLGLRQGLVEFTADLAFLLTPVAADRVDEIFRIEKIPTSAPLLGVSLSQLVEGKFSKHNPLAASQSFAVTLAQALDRFLDHNPHNVMFVSHVIGPRAEHDDRIMCRRVRATMRHRERCTVLEGDYRPDELKGLIARTTQFIGARMHANIAALSSEVPTTAISYSHKTPGIMRLFGLEQQVIDIKQMSEDDIYNQLVATQDNKQALAAQLKTALVHVRERASANVQRLTEILNG